jgi:hypothetical protein
MMPFMLYAMSNTTEEILGMFGKFCSMYFKLIDSQIIPSQFIEKDLNELEGYMI